MLHMLQAKLRVAVRAEEQRIGRLLTVEEYCSLSRRLIWSVAEEVGMMVFNEAQSERVQLAIESQHFGEF